MMDNFVKKIFFLLFTFSLVAYSQQKEVCFTIDDLPIVAYGVDDSTYQKELVDNLVSSLKRNEIPAIGFVNVNKLYSKDTLRHYKKYLLNIWLDGGLELGNHTFSHPDFNNVNCKIYFEDIIRGEDVLKDMLAERNHELKYFRHPFLHVGNSKEKADSLADFLSGRGYVAAPVTIDNDDYLFALCYHRANKKNDKELMRKIGHDYVEYMEQKLNYFEKQSENLFGKNIRQILLLHASLLNSQYVDSLAVMYKKNNYKFISLGKALQDTLYQTPVTKFGIYGISWIDRWALSMGKKGDFFKDDPETPEYIIKMSK